MLKQIGRTILSLQRLTSKVPISTSWYSSPSNANNLDTFKRITNLQPSTQKLEVTGQRESEHDHEEGHMINGGYDNTSTEKEIQDLSDCDNENLLVNDNSTIQNKTESISNNIISDSGQIPVTTRASSRRKDQKVLIMIFMMKASMNPNNKNKCADIDNNKHKPCKFLKIFHQNICGLQNKINELLISLNQDLPEIVCISEHHLEQYQLYKTNLENYTLGTGYCRTKHKKGESCIFIRKGLYFE
jgi:hypothetical protein